jgi:phospholipase C
VTWGWFEGGFRRTAVVKGQAVCGTKHVNSAGKTVEDYEAHHEPFQYYLSTSNPHHKPPFNATTIGTNADRANHQYDVADFWDSVNNHTMPAVSFIKPPAYQDGHPGASDPLAEQTFLVTFMNQLQQTAEWSSTVVVIVYDDSGGQYDHVFHKPVNASTDPAADYLNGAGKCNGTNPAAGGYLDRCGYGPRLPLLVLSPWSQQNYVDSTLNDQTSVIRLIEDRFLATQPSPSDREIGDDSFDRNGSGGSLLGMLDYNHFNAVPFLLDPATGLKQ